MPAQAQKFTNPEDEKEGRVFLNIEGARSRASSSAAPTPVPAARATATGRFEALASPFYAIPLLLALSTLVFIVNLGGYPLYTKGEPREALTAYEMVYGKGARRFILPLRAGVELPSKPPMMHWAVAGLAMLQGGLDEWSVRLPSAIFATAGVIACYLYVRMLFAEGAALLAALILATNFQYAQAATGARVDMTLTFFIELAFFEFLAMAEGFTRRKMLWWAAMTAAVLSKGPVGAALPIAAGAAWCAWERRWNFVRHAAVGRGIALLVIVAGGWYAAATALGASAFVNKQILGENLFRLIYNPGYHQGHGHPFYYLELMLVAGFMPWSLVIPLAALQFVRGERRIDARFRYLVIWFAVVLVIYSVAQSKRAVYLLGLYPALAAMVGICLNDAAAERAPTAALLDWYRIAVGTMLVVAGAAALGALALLFRAPQVCAHLLGAVGFRVVGFVPALGSAIVGWWPVAVLIPLTLGVLGVYVWRFGGAPEKLSFSVAAASAAVALVANLFVVPAEAGVLALKQFTAQAMKIVDGQPVGYLGTLNYDVAFYSRRHIPVVSMRDQNLPRYLLCWEDIYRRMPQARRRRFKEVLVSNPTSVDATGAIVLLERIDGPSAAAIETNGCAGGLVLCPVNKFIKCSGLAMFRHPERRLPE